MNEDKASKDAQRKCNKKGGSIYIPELLLYKT